MVRLHGCRLTAVVWLSFGVAAEAQTNPLAAISGRVTDPSGAAVGGVSISVSSPSLQGERAVETTAAGDFLLPFLPPGDYEIAFRRDGFAEATAVRSLRATETGRLDVRLELAAVSDSMTVSAEPESVIGRAAAVSSTYSSWLLDRLPVDRGSIGAMLLTPGVAAAGEGVLIAGANAYENLYLVDGVPVKEIVEGRPRPFPIEDALEETVTAVTGISAEFGRFTGGVVNAVTRSGGNQISGSARVTFRNDAWRSLTPFERENLAADPREDALEPTYEATLGGPVRRDRLWYFLAGRSHEDTSAETVAYTDVPYRYRNRETRFESKLTWSPAAGQNLRVAWGEIDTREENVVLGGPVMDVASLSPLETPEDLLSVHYSAVLGSSAYLEGQYSRRRRTPTGAGAHTTDLLGGTLLRDGSRGGASWHSPFLCAVCGVPEGELRRAEEGDRGGVLKASVFASSRRAGAHHLVLGGEIFEELRKSNSFQSGSGFNVTASTALLENGSIYPVFLPGGSTVIEWTPIFELSEGSRFRTSSAFVNDSWRLGGRWSGNFGLRWDRDDSQDQSGSPVGSSEAWNPRLAVAFDPRGDGSWTIDAGFARYLAALNFQMGDGGTSRGRPARFLYTYGGPSVNAVPGADPVSTEAALATLFDWFFANGGTSRPLRQAPRIPGLNRRVGDDLVPPTAEELTLGVSRRFGGRGFVRLSGVRRDYVDQYRERADTSTGKVVDPATGRPFDLRLIENGAGVERTYQAILAQIDLRLRPGLRVAGSYTLSETRGNFDGDAGVFPESDLDFFPEYGDPRWRAPSGPLPSDQRHRARLWAMYDVPFGNGGERWGRLSIAALERVDSGQAWSIVGQIDARPYVTNPGYVGPPARVPYYFEGRGSRRTETATATDVAVHYSVPIPGAGRAEIFARIDVVNVFDQSAQTGAGSTTVLTAANDPRYASFDPFVAAPARGVNWDLPPDFGSALSSGDFATPRSWSLALGLRF